MNSPVRTSSGPSPATRLAPAKVNLYLDVLGKRSDGFHELETLFLSLPWGDDVTLEFPSLPMDEETKRDRESSPSVEVHIGSLAVQYEGDSTSIGVPLDETNLVSKAMSVIWKLKPDSMPGFNHVLTLTKRIPVGAGLGGGSSDAATTIGLLAPYLNCALDDDAVLAMARSLGADVSFFLSGFEQGAPFAAIALDRGDRIVKRPCVGKDLVVVLLLTGVACSTAEVFSDYQPGPRRAPSGGVYAARDALTAGNAEDVRAAHFNALAYTVMKRYRKLGTLASAIERRIGRPPALTGSGGTLFDVVRAEDVDALLAAIKDVPIRPVVVPLSS